MKSWKLCAVIAACSFIFHQKTFGADESIKAAPLPAQTNWIAQQVRPKGSVTDSSQMEMVVACRLEGCQTRPAPVDDMNPIYKAPLANEARLPAGPKLPAGMADGRIAYPLSSGTQPGSIRYAYYSQPTTRYDHAILGDGVEASGLVVALQSQDGTDKIIELTLPDIDVFEDLYPRIADLSGFGETHLVTLISHQNLGAAIGVFSLEENALIFKSSTPYVGQPYRWRNIAGIADFDGDGSLQIAEVVTPHIGGTLRFWTWKNDSLVPSGQMFGFSNHAIGSRELKLSTIEDFNQDGVSDIALPSANRKALRMIGFSGRANKQKELFEIASIPLPTRIDKTILSHFDGKTVIITVGLEDGSVWAVHQ